MPMTDDKPIDLRKRTKDFALRVVRLYQALPETGESRVLKNQLLRSATSVGANFREGVRARSSAEFISKLETALQELEETAYWLELLQESGIVKAERLIDLVKETDELTAILVTSVKTVKKRKTK
ncbi:four helix bundle protein [bacterium]|nr:four helix bundle protein [bacterium]